MDSYIMTPRLNFKSKKISGLKYYSKSTKPTKNY